MATRERGSSTPWALERLRPRFLISRLRATRKKPIRRAADLPASRQGKRHDKHQGKRNRPYSLSGAGFACIPHSIRGPEESARARGTPRVQNGPTDLDASQHRGMLKSGPPSRRFGAFGGHSASPPNPWRPARGVYRFAPCRPRWTSRFRQPASPLELEGCLSTASGPGRAGEPATGCRRRHRGAQRRAAGTPGRRGLDRREEKPRRISDASPRPPLPAPRPETLIRHPSLSGRDGAEYNPAQLSGQ